MRGLSRAHPGRARSLHRATNAVAFHLSDLRGEGRGTAPHRSASFRPVRQGSHDGARRPYTRRAARRFTGGEFLARRRNEGHVGGGSVTIVTVVTIANAVTVVTVVNVVKAVQPSRRHDRYGRQPGIPLRDTIVTALPSRLL